MNRRGFLKSCGFIGAVSATGLPAIAVLVKKARKDATFVPGTVVGGAKVFVLEDGTKITQHQLEGSAELYTETLNRIAEDSSLPYRYKADLFVKHLGSCGTVDPLNCGGSVGLKVYVTEKNGMKILPPSKYYLKVKQ